MQHKKCTKCEEEKPATLEYFYRKTKTKDGLQYSCKQCSKAYYEANKEYYKEYSKAYSKAYREANKESLKEYYEANKEYYKEYSKAHYRTPKGKFTHIKKNAKQRGLDFSLSFELYEGKLWGEPCHYCGVDIEVTGLDRKDSSKGYTPGNVVPCCFTCNAKKQGKPYEQFLEEIKKNTCIS